MILKNRAERNVNGSDREEYIELRSDDVPEDEIIGGEKLEAARGYTVGG